MHFKFPIKNIFKYLPTILLLIVLFNIIRSIDSVKKSRERLTNLEKAIDTKLIENKKLKEEIEYAKSDEFLRKNALERLNMTKPNEKILVIPKTIDEKENSKTEFDQKRNEPNYMLWARKYKIDNIIVKFVKT